LCSKLQLGDEGKSAPMRTPDDSSGLLPLKIVFQASDVRWSRLESRKICQMVVRFSLGHSLTDFSGVIIPGSVYFCGENHEVGRASLRHHP
jgi:hypothetical protein